MLHNPWRFSHVDGYKCTITILLQQKNKKKTDRPRGRAKWHALSLRLTQLIQKNIVLLYNQSESRDMFPTYLIATPLFNYFPLSIIFEIRHMQACNAQNFQVTM